MRSKNWADSTARVSSLTKFALTIGVLGSALSMGGPADAAAKQPSGVVVAKMDTACGDAAGILAGVDALDGSDPAFLKRGFSLLLSATKRFDRVIVGLKPAAKVEANAVASVHRFDLAAIKEYTKVVSVAATGNSPKTLAAFQAADGRLRPKLLQARDSLYAAGLPICDSVLGLGDEDDEAPVAPVAPANPFDAVTPTPPAPTNPFAPTAPAPTPGTPAVPAPTPAVPTPTPTTPGSPSQFGKTVPPVNPAWLPTTVPGYTVAPPNALELLALDLLVADAKDVFSNGTILRLNDPSGKLASTVLAYQFAPAFASPSGQKAVYQLVIADSKLTPTAPVNGFDVAVGGPLKSSLYGNVWKVVAYRGPLLVEFTAPVADIATATALANAYLGAMPATFS